LSIKRKGVVKFGSKGQFYAEGIPGGRSKPGCPLKEAGMNNGGRGMSWGKKTVILLQRRTGCSG